jgi:hypothetical protein
MVDEWKFGWKLALDEHDLRVVRGDVPRWMG